jgi:hypothetical protein
VGSLRSSFGLVLLALAACGDDANALWGSIDEVYSLDFDHVAVVEQAPSLVVEYIRDTSAGDELPCRLVVDGSAVALEDGSRIEDDIFTEIVTVTRVTADNREFPTEVGGYVEFRKYSLNVGSRVVGTFAVRFEADNSGSRILNGNFDGKVEASEGN